MHQRVWPSKSSCWTRLKDYLWRRTACALKPECSGQWQPKSFVKAGWPPRSKRPSWPRQGCGGERPALTGESRWGRLHLSLVFPERGWDNRRVTVASPALLRSIGVLDGAVLSAVCGSTGGALRPLSRCRLGCDGLAPEEKGQMNGVCLRPPPSTLSSGVLSWSVTPPSSSRISSWWPESCPWSLVLLEDVQSIFSPETRPKPQELPHSLRGGMPISLQL